jgi:hypothetical protein
VCRKCWHVKDAESRPEAAQERYKRSNLKGLYNLTLEQFEAILEGQGGVCAICHEDSPRGCGWSVDHDHGHCPGRKSCGECIRGILCGPCNAGLGMFNDDTERVRRAVRYIENHDLSRGVAVIEEILGLDCPRCGNEGPHRRTGVTMDGSFALAECSDSLCALVWKVTS